MTDTSAPQPAVTSRHVARGLGTTLLSRLGGVIDIVAQPLYVAMFGLASYGLYAVLWASINLAENVLDLGMTSALQRTVPQAGNDRNATASLRAAMILGILPCLIAAALVTIYAADVALFFNVAPKDAPLLVPALRLFVWAMPLWALVEIATSSLRARQVFGAEIRLRVFWEQVIRLGLAVAAWAMGFGLMGLFIAHLLSLTATAILSLRLVARYYRLDTLWTGPFLGPIFLDTAKAGLSILPANVVARLFGDAPAVILNAALPGAAGASAAALFVIARKISSLVQLLRMAFAYVLAPLASAASSGDAKQIRHLYAFCSRLLCALALPMSMVIAAGGPAILRLFGPSAQAAATALALMVAGRVADALTGAATPILQVTRSYRSQLAGSIAGVAAAAAVLAVTMPEGGLNAVTLAVSIGLTLASIVPMAQLWIWGGLHPFDAHYGRVFAIAIGISLAGAAAARAALQLPAAAQLPVLAIILLGSIWSCCRYGLPLDDRRELGKTGRALRLA